MGHEPLTPEDATLLCATDPGAQLQIGAVCLFEAAPLRDTEGRLRLDDLRHHMQARLAISPRFRQRVQPIAFDAARPVWLDDGRFDIAHHVRTATVPSPGGRKGLRLFLRDLLSGPLDPQRPLWEAWVVDGIDTEHVAVVLRVHHVMADGLSLLDAAMLLLDPEPHHDPDVPGRWNPEPAPGTDRLLLEALAARSRHQLAIGLATMRAVVDPRLWLAGLRAITATAAAGVSLAPSLPINRRVGTSRDFTWVSLSMPDLVAVKRAQGTTLNDVVLAVVTGALRSHLGEAAAEQLTAHPPRALVPVGSFDAAAAGEAGNAFSFVVADLPFATSDPVEQLALIHAQMDTRKAGGQQAAASALFSVIDVVPLPLLRWLGPQALSRQPFVNLAVTNVPGSRAPLYLLGAHLEELHPIVTGVGNIALIIGVLSYQDQLGVGVTVDPDVVPDAEGLADHIRSAADQLVEASRRPRRRQSR